MSECPVCKAPLAQQRDRGNKKPVRTKTNVSKKIGAKKSGAAIEPPAEPSLPAVGPPIFSALALLQRHLNDDGDGGDKRHQDNARCY